MSTAAASAVCERGLVEDVTVRSIDEETRTATFVAATENGVDTWTGREVLRMSGANLTRYRKNPVVLDAHNRYAAGDIVGKGRIKREERELVVDITFAETDRAERAWQLVRTDFLRAVSVGFIPRKVRDIVEDETDGEGEYEITGPARIVTEWELIEISVVPVPADADAVRRSFFSEERRMEKATTKEEAAAVDTPPATEEQRQPEEPKAPGTAPAPQERAAEPPTEPVPEEIRARSIRALAPNGMGVLAEQCILEGLSIEDARKRLLEEHTKHMTPVGTPEPTEPEKRAPEGDGETKLDDLDDDMLTRSLTG